MALQNLLPSFSAYPHWYHLSHSLPQGDEQVLPLYTQMILTPLLSRRARRHIQRCFWWCGTGFITTAMWPCLQSPSYWNCWPRAATPVSQSYLLCHSSVTTATSTCSWWGQSQTATMTSCGNVPRLFEQEGEQSPCTVEMHALPMQSYGDLGKHQWRTSAKDSTALFHTIRCKGHADTLYYIHLLHSRYKLYLITSPPTWGFLSLSSGEGSVSLYTTALVTSMSGCCSFASLIAKASA